MLPALLLLAYGAAGFGARRTLPSLSLRATETGAEVVREVPRAPPPQTMSQCVTQAQTAAMACIDDGNKLLEVEFPPLPSDQMEAPDTSAYDVSRANTNVAIKFAKAFGRRGQRVAILYPDVAELERAIEEVGSAQPAANVSLHSLRKPFIEAESFDQLFLAIFGKGKKMVRQGIPDADVYVCLTFSAQELPDLQTLFAAEQETKPVILFNLKLDTQRGDLGLPAFPPKSLQWGFLSRVKPAYYLRTRQYSLSLPQPPFVINYQGAIFRCYPDNYQSLLDVGTDYRCVEASDRRPALGEFKETITDALRIGVEQNKVQKFARTGFKFVTWWEEDKDKNELFSDWRQ